MTCGAILSTIRQYSIPRDAIIKFTACEICGSDLHLFDGVIPTMKGGDIVEHETMGEVVGVGSEITNQASPSPA